MAAILKIYFFASTFDLVGSIGVTVTSKIAKIVLIGNPFLPPQGGGGGGRVVRRCCVSYITGASN